MPQNSWTLAARASAPGGAPVVQEKPQAQRIAGSVQGRVAIVTGGATGLGRATCLEFAQQGVAVAFNYLDLPERDVSAQALLTETAIKAHGVAVYCAAATSAATTRWRVSSPRRASGWEAYTIS